MTWPLPQPNTPPPCCCSWPRKFPPPFVEGIVVVVDIGSVDIVVEDIVFVDITLVDIDQDDTEVCSFSLHLIIIFH